MKFYTNFSNICWEKFKFEICTLLGYYAAISENPLPTFRNIFKGQGYTSRRKPGITQIRVWLQSHKNNG